MYYHVEYGGGLGDIFNQMYAMNSYAFFETLSSRDRATVVLITHNPYAREFFDYHPNAGLMNICVPGYWQPEEDRKMRRIHNLPAPPPLRPMCSKPVRFFPAPSDEPVLRQLPADFVLMAVSAGLPDRSIPPEVVDDVTEVLLSLGVIPVFVGRSYDRAGRTEYVPGADGVVNLVDQLSAPGVAEALHRSRGAVCCHSAINILAWRTRKPQLLLYSQSTLDRHFRRPDEWSFGAGYPETRHGLFHDARIQAWVVELFSSGS